MDYLIMENMMFLKSGKPKWAEGKNWREEFVLD